MANRLIEIILNRAEQIVSVAKSRMGLGEALEQVAIDCAVIEKHAAELCRTSRDFILIANSVVAGATSLDTYNELANKLQQQILLALEQIEINRGGK